MTWLLMMSVASAEAPDVDQGVGTPWTVGKGHGTVGLFRPLHIGLAETTDLRVHTSAIVGVLGLGAGVTHRVWETDEAAVAVEVDLSMPSLGLSMANGTLFPSTTDHPAALVSRVAVLGGWTNKTLVVTAGPVARVGLPFGTVELETPDFFWLDGMVAPLTEGPQVGGRLQVDGVVSSRAVVQGRWQTMFGPLGPDHHARLWATLGLGRVNLGLGTAFAWERDTLGRDFFWMPVGDVQIRW